MLLLLGSTGRIGRIVAAEAADAGVPIGAVDRAGDIRADGLTCGNIWNPDYKPEEPVYIADCSVDYSSAENMVSLETKKRALIQRLAERGKVAAYLTISSGAVEFDDSLILSDFHLEYKRQKIANEALAMALGGRCYCPRIYTLIGPETFKVKSVGWVNVIEQCRSSQRVMIDEKNELRSWISERVLRLRLGLWLRGTEVPQSETPICGTFSMSQIAEYMAHRLRKPLELVGTAMAGWLSVPYLASEANYPDSLDDVLDFCLGSG